MTNYTVFFDGRNGNYRILCAGVIEERAGQPVLYHWTAYATYKTVSSANRAIRRMRDKS